MFRHVISTPQQQRLNVPTISTVEIIPRTRRSHFVPDTSTPTATPFARLRTVCIDATEQLPDPMIQIRITTRIHQEAFGHGSTLRRQTSTPIKRSSTTPMRGTEMASTRSSFL